jgi:DNA (cytosine-5)-methyltransferase 1
VSAYYNEFDPFAAEWLRELMRAGLIPEGWVDERSIVDVQPDDLLGFTQCHFFAGIGGWAEALRLADWGDAPVWTGSPPCQPFSVAGQRKGDKDERHLWPEMFRLIKACKPANYFGEQVAAAIGHGWLDGVFNDLESEGYACGAAVLPACAVGAPHRRDRLFFVADASDAERRTVAQRRDERDGSNAGRNQTSSGHSIFGAVALADAKGERRDGRSNTTEFARGSVAETDGGALADAVGRVEQSGRAQSNIRPIPGGDEKSSAGSGALADADGLIRGGVENVEPAGQFAELECDTRTCAVGDAAGIGRREGRTKSDIWRGRAAVTVASVSGDANDERRQEQRSAVAMGAQQPSLERASGKFWSDAEWVTGADGKSRPVKPGVRLLGHGIPARVGRLRGYGNAIVPQVAAEFIGAFLDARNIMENDAILSAAGLLDD